MEYNIHFDEVSKNPLEDNATGGTCFNAYISTGEYIELIKDIYKESNKFQRRLMDPSKNEIYKKLVDDLRKGVVIPTISLYFDNVSEIKKSITIDTNNVRILDGLQRTNCIIYANNSYAQKTLYDYGMAPKTYLDQKEFLNKKIRVEIWTNLTINGILYKMVSLNAGQTPMSIEHQFEVIELPLLRELQKNEIKIKSRYDEDTELDNGFLLSTVIEGVIAYSFTQIFPRKQQFAIDLLNRLDVTKEDHDSTIMKNETLMIDLIWALKDFHYAQISKYSETDYKGILSNKNTFFIPFMAALGKARRMNRDSLETKKAELIKLLNSSDSDPLNLDQYTLSSSAYTSGIGTKRRKIVYIAFYSYFSGNTNNLDWINADNLI